MPAKKHQKKKSADSELKPIPETKGPSFVPLYYCYRLRTTSQLSHLNCHTHLYPLIYVSIHTYLGQGFMWLCVPLCLCFYNNKGLKRGQEHG